MRAGGEAAEFATATAAGWAEDAGVEFGAAEGAGFAAATDAGLTGAGLEDDAGGTAARAGVSAAEFAAGGALGLDVGDGAAGFGRAAVAAMEFAAGRACCGSG